MTIGPNTRIAALIGEPVGHSFSPIIHNAAYQILGLDAIYLAVSVADASLPDAINGMRALGFMGANVTIPHKERVMSMVDSLTDEARAIGAVNTIIFRKSADGALEIVGDNTDVTGFLSPLQRFQERLRGESVAILGAGGAARAVLFGVLTTLKPERVDIAARRSEQGQNLVNAFQVHASGAKLASRPFADAGGSVRDATLVVNTTPVGMYPNTHETPLQDADLFHPEQIVYDLIYNPVRTRLLGEASRRGATVINGIEMLIGQAAAAHMMWTGFRMPVDEVEEVLLQAVGG